MIRLKLRLEFEGSATCGWQLQSESEEARQPSLQGLLESTIAIVLRRGGERFVVQGCGRTDAGVHAEEFFCHVDLPDGDWDEAGALERFRHKVNSILPPQVVITRAELAPGFHALNDVERKIYRYNILLRRAKPVLRRGQCLWLPVAPDDVAALDLNRIRLGLKILEGEHDFVAFAAANSSAKTTVRRLLRCEMQEAFLSEDESSGKLVQLSFEGTGFLKQMVRNMVGTLIEVGQNRRTVESIAELLGHTGRVGTRIEAGACAPAEGLCLVKVFYGHGTC